MAPANRWSALPRSQAAAATSARVRRRLRSTRRCDAGGLRGQLVASGGGRSPRLDGQRDVRGPARHAARRSCSSRRRASGVATGIVYDAKIHPRRSSRRRRRRRRRGQDVRLPGGPPARAGRSALAALHAEPVHRRSDATFDVSRVGMQLVDTSAPKVAVGGYATPPRASWTSTSPPATTASACGSPKPGSTAAPVSHTRLRRRRLLRPHRTTRRSTSSSRPSLPAIASRSTTLGPGRHDARPHRHAGHNLDVARRRLGRQRVDRRRSRSRSTTT